MDQILINSLLGAFIISLFSLIGAFGFALKDDLLKRISLFLVAFSTGALLGGAFFHLLPEAVDKMPSMDAFILLLAGIMTFYLLEKIMKWRHCHKEGECGIHIFTYMSLVGDGIHNFIDGLIIVSAFYINFEVGLATVIAVASHEIPQEMGDFGVLIHGGFSRGKALLWNFISALAAVLGVLIGYCLVSNVDNISLALLPFAAGGFVYISMADLIPELHKESGIKKSVLNFVLLAAGLIFMYITKIFFE